MNSTQLLNWRQILLDWISHYPLPLVIFFSFYSSNADAIPAKAKTGIGAKTNRIAGQPRSGPVGQSHWKRKNSYWKWKSKSKVIFSISVFHLSTYVWICIASHFQVRQMFDERRQRVAGIDKSYPLQPITTRPMPNAVSRPVKATTVMKFRFVLMGVANKFNRRCKSM